MKEIKIGSKDPDVLFLQGIIGSDTDGIFGANTLKKFNEWQGTVGMLKTEVCNDSVWNYIIENYRAKITSKDWKDLANSLGCEVNVLKAIKTVETGSIGAYDKNSRPTILFEAHLFYANLKRAGLNPDHYLKTNPGITSKTWNKALYKGGAAEWDRLREAWVISPKAALQSASWGFPQILGQNFSDPFKFVSDFYISEAKQLEYFGKFLKNQGFAPYLKSKDWAKIASKYNGPSYAKNSYDKKLAEAYKKLNK